MDEANFMAQSSSRATWVNTGATLLIVLLCGFVGLVLTRLIAPPLQAATAALERVAEKDLTVHVDESGTDEIGRMTTALNTSVGSMRSVLQSVAQGAGAELLAVDAEGNLPEGAWETLAAADAIIFGSPTYMGSVLMDRGDRISWTGDAYVSQSTFYSFASDYSIALQNLNLTSCDDCCQGIASYCLLFVLSACDYLAQTGDTASFQYFLPVITRKLEEGYRRYYGDFSLHSMRFWGVNWTCCATRD